MLAEILAHKRQEVEKRKQFMPLETIRGLLHYLEPCRPFLKTLQAKKAAHKPAVIAEIKQASPSKGVLRTPFDPVDIASSYMRYDAACLSVLTDQHFFQGADAYIRQIKQEVSLPILRKDFMVDAYQIYESRVIGADAVLLIAAALDAQDLIALATLARELGMDILLEIHSLEELKSVLALEEELIATNAPVRFDLIGINNRDLHSFVTDIQVSLDLLHYIPASRFIISESGIASRQQINLLAKAGVDGFLIGEALMRAESPGVMLAQLFQEQVLHTTIMRSTP